MPPINEASPIDRAVAAAFDPIVQCDDATLCALRDRVVTGTLEGDQVLTAARPRRDRMSRGAMRTAVAMFAALLAVAGVAVAGPGGEGTMSLLSRLNILQDEDVPKADDPVGSTHEAELAGPRGLPETMGRLLPDQGKATLLSQSDKHWQARIWIAPTSTGNVCFYGVAQQANDGPAGSPSGACLADVPADSPVASVVARENGRTVLFGVASDDVKSVTIVDSSGRQSEVDPRRNAFFWGADGSDTEPRELRVVLLDGRRSSMTVGMSVTERQQFEADAKLQGICSLQGRPNAPYVDPEKCRK